MDGEKLRIADLHGQELRIDNAEAKIELLHNAMLMNGEIHESVIEYIDALDKRVRVLEEVLVNGQSKKED